MLELRWYESKLQDWQWNSRGESWYRIEISLGKPVLQYRLSADAEWQPVPIVEEITGPSMPPS